MPNFIVAPYWTTCNRDTGGQVLYITQETGDYILERVNRIFASEGFDFVATWMLIVHWFEIPGPDNFEVEKKLVHSVIVADAIYGQL